MKTFFKNIAISYGFIVFGSTIGTMAGLYLFYHGSFPKESWVYVSLAILVLSFILAIPGALVRQLISFPKLYDSFVAIVLFLIISIFFWKVFSPSPRTIFYRHVIDQEFSSLTVLQGSINYEDNGNHVVRLKFKINENDFTKILKVKGYSLNQKAYAVEFPSIPKLDWWDNSFTHFPMYVGFSVKEKMKVAHINDIWYDKVNTTGYFLQFRFPSEKDKGLDNNLKFIEIR